MKLLDEADCAAIWLPAFQSFAQEFVRLDTFSHASMFVIGLLLGGPFWTGHLSRTFSKFALWARSALRFFSATGQGTKRD